MTIAETIESFTTDKQDALKHTLRDDMGCHEPTCYLDLQISSGSINVAALLTIPNSAPNGIDTAALASNVQAAATQLVSQDAATISASLGVSVTSTAPVSVQTDVVVPLVVAPPPPSPPPSPPPPSSPPGGTGAGGGGMTTIIIAAAGALVAGGAFTYVTRSWLKSRSSDVPTIKGTLPKRPAGDIAPAHV